MHPLEQASSRIDSPFLNRVLYKLLELIRIITWRTQYQLASNMSTWVLASMQVKEHNNGACVCDLTLPSARFR